MAKTRLQLSRTVLRPKIIGKYSTALFPQCSKFGPALGD
jgi:hypothetical protein